MGTFPAGGCAPSRATLIDARFDGDSCGVGFVAQLSNVPSHAILTSSLTALGRLAHRGAVAADGKSSDGVGILTQIPRDFLLRTAGIALAPERPLAVGVLFLERETEQAEQQRFSAALATQQLAVLAWRTVPVDTRHLGEQAAASLPAIQQVLVTTEEFAGLDRRLYLARKRFERELSATHVCSLSTSTLVYKALCAGRLLPDFYPDLADAAYTTAFAIFHQRYATNALPAWRRAQPLRMLAHNGEINTVWGNRARMDARASTIPAECHPLLTPDGSDSTSLDEAVELLARNGRSAAEAVRMLLPPARGDAESPFMRYHEDCVEPWDGPAAVAFADGAMVGAAMDRNGLRPCRYFITEDGWVVAGSEAGLVDLDPERIVTSGQLGPGEMIAVDLEKHTVLDTQALLQRFDSAIDYDKLLPDVRLEAESPAPAALTADVLQRAQLTYGYSKEDVKMVLQPMAADGKEAVWSMGDDTPLAPLARSPRPVYNYLRQRFAQVTNPPIDSLREACVVKLHTRLGPWPHMLDPHARIPGLSLSSPFLSLPQMEALKQGEHALRRELPTGVLPCFFSFSGGLEQGLRELCARAIDLVGAGTQILILSDRGAGQASIPLPMALATGAVHQALVNAGLRTRTGLAVEAGDCRDLHHGAVLLGYGAGVVCPWLALETAREHQPACGEANLLHAFDVGLAKIMSKMGISVVDSYRGAHLFDCIGLSQEVVEMCLFGTPAPLGGIGWPEIEAAVRRSWARCYGDQEDDGGQKVLVSVNVTHAKDLPDFGAVRYRKADGAEWHAWQPQRVRFVQSGVGSARNAVAVADSQSPVFANTLRVIEETAPTTLRDMLAFQPAGPALASDTVESAENIVTRFIASAMSLGSLSPEAHGTITEAMNALGARSNTGEGGEDPEAYRAAKGSGARGPHDNKVKQLASGRFGVTAEYLAHAEEIEIKIAQGSKPGEGGQLPAHKVTELIARLRHAQPGISLISPPPHHDIYSIEDLAQLIYDLKRVNPRAAVGVKLVSSCGVGTIAAGVAKAYADYIVIAGGSGGTGASPLSSIKHAGNPWELGLAEAQQVLVANGLRGRVRLRCDGGLQTARDVLAAAMLGADEFAFGTAVLVALGCDMARQCHLNTCPTGIATQRPELRAKFRGKPEHVIRFFEKLAEDVRLLLAELGLRRLEDAVGRTDLLTQVRRTGALDLQPMLGLASGPVEERRWAGRRNDRPESAAPLDERWVETALAAGRKGETFAAASRIGNGDRTFGARLAGRLALEGLDRSEQPAQLRFCLQGVAGQSFGAFAVRGMHLELDGLANDFVGKGLSGGEIILRGAGRAARDSGHHALLGNVALYGATGGALYAAGRAGERFAVRNSGAVAVVEGVGDHGCEYMTGGAVVVLGQTGFNFGAGMTGGTAWVLDEDGGFMSEARFHPEFVQPVPFQDCTLEEQCELRALVEKHAAKTGSRRAGALLGSWESEAGKLLRLMPRV